MFTDFTVLKVMILIILLSLEDANYNFSTKLLNYILHKVYDFQFYKSFLLYLPSFSAFSKSTNKIFSLYQNFLGHLAWFLFKTIINGYFEASI